MMPRRRKNRFQPYHEMSGLSYSERSCTQSFFPEDHTASRASPSRGYLKPHSSFASSQPKPHFTASIKVENLSKATTQATLKRRIGHLERRMGHLGMVDIHVMNCGPSHPANYAYVNCPSQTTAELVIHQLDNSLLDGNLLRAKLKGGHSECSSDGKPAAAGHSSSGPLPSRVQPERDLGSVKVLIHGDHQFITGEPLDEYFSRYGEVTTRSIIRRGSPDYAYINFRNPVSAERCRSESPHSIQGVTVIAPPFKTTKGVHHSSNVSNLASSEYTCDPLVVNYVEKDTKHYFQTNGHQVKVLAREDKISLYAFTEGKGVTGEIEEFVKKNISEHEAKVQSIDKTLDCCYLPAMVDPAVQKKLNEIQVTFDFMIKAEESKTMIASCAAAQSSYITLGELSHAYGKCDHKTVHAEELKCYLFPSGPSEHQWYWEEREGEFKPYDKALCEKLDQVQASDVKTTQVPIGRHSYEIDTLNMLQTNMMTKKKRKVKRDTVSNTEKYSFAIRIRAHSDHLREIKKEIMKTLESALIESSLSLPIDQDTSFIRHLLQTARQSFVSADTACGSSNSITLKGVFEAEKRTEIKLQEEILAKQIEETKSARLKASYEGLSRPASWEKQEGKCELKDVVKGSEEWKAIEQRVKESASNMSIVRIERIQNLWLWEVYMSSKKRMSDKNHGTVNEKQLFHGSRYTPPKAIYNSEQGFDNRLASKGMWGEGSYFAVKASYSDRYAHTTTGGHRQMFLAHVLTGITCMCKSNHSMKAPPKKSEMTPSGSRGSHAVSMFEDERYDSVSGVTDGSEIFVIYEHGKVYPAYLITYQTNFSFL